MGKLLFIRVCAATYDEDEVEKTWPRLYRLAWPEKSDIVEKKVEEAFGSSRKGVLELAERAVDILKYGKGEETKLQSVPPLAEELQKALRGLEDALGDRDIQQANKFTINIEQSLDALENALKTNPA